MIVKGRYLSPYVKDNDLLNGFGRKLLNSDKYIFCVFETSVGWKSVGSIKIFETKTDAMNELDLYLIAKGYKILNQEDWYKYSVLL